MKILSSTPLQSLNASNFFGNKLCVPPLTNNCTIKDVQPNTENKEHKVFSGLEVDWFYVFMALGFVVGFWVVLGPLLLNRQWRVCTFNSWITKGTSLGVQLHKLGSVVSNCCKILNIQCRCHVIILINSLMISL